MSIGAADLRSSLTGKRAITVGDLHARLPVSPDELVSHLESLEDSGDIILSGPAYDQRTVIKRRE